VIALKRNSLGLGLVVGSLLISGSGFAQTDSASVAKLGAIEYVKDTAAVSTPCDDLNGAFLDSFETLGDDFDARLEAYRQSERVISACEATRDQIETVPIPSTLPDSIKAKLAATATECRTAYDGRVIALRLMQTILDGDARPSVASRASTAFGTSGAAITQCGIKMLESLAETGLTRAEVKVMLK
jgi:hypothetical protein